MKLKELRELLNSLPDTCGDMEVQTEGCDCTGDVARIHINYTQSYIELERSAGTMPYLDKVIETGKPVESLMQVTTLEELKDD